MNANYCEKCGAKLPREAVFCPFCGTCLIEEDADLKTKSNKKYLCVTLIAIMSIILLIALSVTLIRPNDSKDEVADIKSTQAIDDGRTHFDGYSLMLTDNWTYLQEGTSVHFYSKYCYENNVDDISKGYLFSIDKTTQTHADYAEHTELLGSKDGYNYILVYPMGMGLSSDEMANEERSKAMEEQDDVISSFQLDDASTSNGNTLENSQNNEMFSNSEEFDNNAGDLYSQNDIIEEDRYEQESYYHTAIKGAVIISQDGGKSFSYQGHCEACGKTDTTMTKNVTASSGVLKSSFLCPNCNNQQAIEIKSGKN